MTSYSHQLTFLFLRFDCFSNSPSTSISSSESALWARFPKDRSFFFFARARFRASKMYLPTPIIFFLDFYFFEIFIAIYSCIMKFMCTFAHPLLFALHWELPPLSRKTATVRKIWSNTSCLQAQGLYGGFAVWSRLDPTNGQLVGFVSQSRCLES